MSKVILETKDMFKDTVVRTTAFNPDEVKLGLYRFVTEVCTSDGIVTAVELTDSLYAAKHKHKTLSDLIIEDPLDDKVILKLRMLSGAINRVTVFTVTESDMRLVDNLTEVHWVVSFKLKATKLVEIFYTTKDFQRLRDFMETYDFKVTEAHVELFDKTRDELLNANENIHITAVYIG